MKILYVVSRPLEINTSASVRNRATILGLLENGYTVHLLTTEADENHQAYDAQMSVASVCKTTYIHLKGIQAAARFGRKWKFLSPLRRIAYRWFSRKEVYDNLKGIAEHTDCISLKDEKYDVIISSSDPKSSHLFVFKLLEQQGSDFAGRWIQIWGDPFAGDITLSAKSKYALIQKEEKRLLARADKVVYVSKPTLEAQQQAYPECGEKMCFFPIPYMERSVTENRDLVTAPVVNLLYCGDYNSKIRDILPLYNAVKSLKGVHLTICGNADITLESCENVTVYARLPYHQVLDMEKETDILVHLSNLRGTQIPGKIYQYSGTNKPILFILDGDINKIREQFEEYHRYEFCLNDIEDIQKTISELICSGKEYIPSPEFDKKIIAQKVLNDIH